MMTTDKVRAALYVVILGVLLADVLATLKVNPISPAPFVGIGGYMLTMCLIQWDRERRGCR